MAFGPGILVGLLLWVTHKGKSTYVSGQGLQAALYQLLGMIVIMGLWVVWAIFYALTWIPLVQNPAQLEQEPPPIFWIGLRSKMVSFLGMVIFALYGLWGAWQAGRGRDFNYALVGRLTDESSAIGEA